MRDCYNRITPNFEEWEKLGWICTEIHEQTFTLSRPEDTHWDFTQIVFELGDDTESPKVWKERISLYSCGEEPFTAEEQALVDADIKNYYEETAVAKED